MATKLKNLMIKKVDFVDAGANPDAHIMLYKNKDGVVGGETQQEEEPKQEGMFKRFISLIGKAVGLKPEEISATIEEITKSEAESFGDKMNEFMNRKITDEVWDLCYALQSSLCSIICDSESDNSRLELMQTSLEEFASVMNNAIQKWAQGSSIDVIKKVDISDTNVDLLTNARDRLNEMIEKAAEKNNGEPKGVEIDMGKIDKSKLTPEEKAFLEDIEKRYDSEGVSTPNNDSQTTTLPSVTEEQTTIVPEEQSITAGEDNIYKGLHPAIVKELEELRKRADAAEEKELLDIAKKYEIIGKKPEELVPMLKSLKRAGGNTYDDMISILDASVTAVEKSGLFSEIGKSGAAYTSGETEAIAKVRAKVSELRKARPELTDAQATDQVLMEDEQLRAEFDQ